MNQDQIQTVMSAHRRFHEQKRRELLGLIHRLSIDTGLTKREVCDLMEEEFED